MYGFMCICIDLYVYIWVYMDVYGNLAMLTDFANSNTVDSGVARGMVALGMRGSTRK